MRHLMLAAAISALSTAAFAASPLEGSSFLSGTQIASGTLGGSSWTAQKLIIGQTPTSDVLPPTNTIGGGDPLYKPSGNKSGVVALIMEYAGGAAFICSGSLLPGGTSILTAAHCVSDGAGTANPIKTTAYFFNGDADSRTPFQSVGTAIEISNYAVHPSYTGEVIDQNDIAVLRLASRAPDEYQRYALYEKDIKGKNFNVAGYGTRSTVGGAAGNTAPAGARTGFLREGDNKYDYAWGDPLFQDFFTEIIGGENFFGTAEVEYSYVSDFDNGLAAQSQSRRVANALGLGLIGNQFFDDNGLGAREVGIAGGDSGGPGFIDGMISSVNSYGLTFGAAFGDFGGGLNAGWGEFSGYVPTFIHVGWISEVAGLPEPSSLALGLLAVAGAAGASRRRRPLN